LRLLLDTHLLVWAGAFEAGRSALSATAVTLIADEANIVFFSPISVWEVAIKSGLGRAGFQIDPVSFRRALLDNGYVEIEITSAHAVAVARLPPLHKDPFDRMLLAQALVEGATLLTVDTKLAQYGALVLRV
jgi:PIN domain nuclease of toxin-antitoxin system